MNPLTNFRFWIGAAIGLLCLWLAVRDVPFAHLGNYLAGVKLYWLLPAIVAQVVAIIARAQRWVVLLRVRKKLSDSFWAQNVGYLFTNVLPLRLGEPARVISMSERCGLPVVQVAASAVVERLLDVITIVVVMLLVLPWMSVPTFVTDAGIGFSVLSLLVLSGLLLAVHFRSSSDKLIKAVCDRIGILPRNKVTTCWQELVNGLVPLSHWPTAIRAALWSAVTWFFSIVMYWSVLHAFQSNSLMLEAAFMLVALSFAVTVPSSPGFIGVFQLVGQQALVLPFGGKYDEASALAITLTGHVTYYLLTTALGVIGLWKLGKSFVNFGHLVTSGRSVQKQKSRSGEAVS